MVGFEVSLHPAYSLELILSDFHLLGHMKTALRGATLSVMTVKEVVICGFALS
jgi:hypothetical protein